MSLLRYNPGHLPSITSPKPGEVIEIYLPGYPPYKDRSRSIRNPEHRIYSRFVTLREEGYRAMAGRARYDGPIRLDLLMLAPAFEKGKILNDYTGGVMDCLDGSHGPSFTYLPVVYEDDCQVCAGLSSFREASEAEYSIRVVFLGAELAEEPSWVDPVARLEVE